MRQLQPTFTTDIERALQHAVGEVNNTFSLSTADDDGHSKKKRQREEETSENQVAVKEKKRKKKYHHAIEHGAEPTFIAQQEPIAATSTANEVQVEQEEPPKKKRSRKRDKGKQPVQQSDFAPQFGYDYPPYGSQPPQYLPFPPPVYPAPAYPPPSQYAPPPPDNQFFPIPPDFNALGGSTEDILRALQDLDLSKIANVLRTLNDAAAAAHLPPIPLPSSSYHPAPPHQPYGSASSLSEVRSYPLPHSFPHQEDTTHLLRQGPASQISTSKKPATADAILGRQPKEQQTRKAVDPAMLMAELPPNPEHATLLATKWMSATKLAEMVKSEGLVYKKGKFSVIEQVQLQNAIEEYRVKYQLSHEDIYGMIFSKTDKKDQAFWSEITSALSQRPIIAVYHHVRRTSHPLKSKGAWTPSEDDALERAVSELGQQWEKISLLVCRMASDCRDRYRNHIANRDKRLHGHWSKEEEEQLTRIVREMTIEQGKTDVDNDVFWGVVAQRMGNSRGRQQCRIKWTDALSKTFKNEGQKPRWSQEDAHVLVHKVDSLKVQDDTEIDWKQMPDESWNLWSAHTLQRRWMTMKRSVRGWEDMSHQEIVDILRLKKAERQPEPVHHKRRGKAAPRSAEVVDDADGEGEDDGQVGQAGPSSVTVSG